MRNQYRITLLMFSCLPLPGCAWQHSRPITSVTTGRRCMACSTVTAMWRCPISCSAPWVTSWQKSYRRQKMKRSTWSTHSSLCRGESWVWSIFFLTWCMLPGQSAFRLGTCSFLASKMGMEGASLGIWQLSILLLLALWKLPSVAFSCEKKNPNPFPPI